MEFFFVFLIIMFLFYRFARYVFKPERLEEDPPELRRMLREVLTARQAKSAPPYKPISESDLPPSGAVRHPVMPVPLKTVSSAPAPFIESPPPSVNVPLVENQSPALAAAPALTATAFELPTHAGLLMPFNPQALAQRLDMAGLVSSRLDENLRVPSCANAGMVLQLKDLKRMVILPPDAPADYVQTSLRMYDYVIHGEAGQEMVLRRFDGFVKEKMFG